jgi:hypothetical protein
VLRPRLDYESHATGLDRNELGALLVAADLALVWLLALNGLRVSEATGADIEALGVERGHRTLVVKRKGGKLVTIPLSTVGTMLSTSLDADVPLRDVQKPPRMLSPGAQNRVVGAIAAMAAWPDGALTPNAGLAAVTGLCDRLGVIGALDAAVGPVKQRDRGFGAGQLLTGIAAAQLAGEDFLTGLDRHRADAAGQQLTPVPGLSPPFRGTRKPANTADESEDTSPPPVSRRCELPAQNCR